MTTAADVIRRALRLINVPGRGSILSGQDMADGFEELRSILRTSAVSRVVQPGIRRHFFPLVAGQASYSYGPGGDFDSTLFEDPTPVRIEDAFIRAGGTIQTNELVTDGDFPNAAAWTLDAGWTITNGSARISAGNENDAIVQAVTVAVRPYRVRLHVTRRAGSIRLLIVTPGSTLLQTISTSGEYEFEFTPGAAVTTNFSVLAADAEASADLTFASMLPLDSDRVELLSGGVDYALRELDQRSYNRIGSKDEAGRPCAFEWSRDYPRATIRFDQGGTTGDIFVADVTVNRLDISSPSETLRVHDDALEWLAYRLAFQIAPQFGKQLSPSAVRVMDQAYNAMTAANARPNGLRVDRALRPRPRFDINRGDV